MLVHDRLVVVVLDLDSVTRDRDHFRLAQHGRARAGVHVEGPDAPLGHRIETRRIDRPVGCGARLAGAAAEEEEESEAGHRTYLPTMKRKNTKQATTIPT